MDNFNEIIANSGVNFALTDLYGRTCDMNSRVFLLENRSISLGKRISAVNRKANFTRLGLVFLGAGLLYEHIKVKKLEKKLEKSAAKNV